MYDRNHGSSIKLGWLRTKEPLFVTKRYSRQSEGIYEHLYSFCLAPRREHRVCKMERWSSPCCRAPENIDALQCRLDGVDVRPSVGIDEV